MSSSSKFAEVLSGKFDRFAEKGKAIIDEFYKECGWDKDTGLPKKEKLEELDLDWLLQG